MNKYKTIIWDWNGTLLNDISLCVNITNDLIKNHSNERLDVKSYKDVFGFPITAYYQKIGFDFNKESFQQLTVKFISAYNSQVKHCQLQNNAKKVLDTFKKKGIPQYILTAAHKEDVKVFLKHFSLDNHFVQVEGLDNYKADNKVNAGIKLINDYNIERENTVLIGDTIHDYQVAGELGIDCILIANGHQSRERLLEKTKDKIPVLKDIGQLLK